MTVREVNIYDVGQEVRFSVVFAVGSTDTDPTTITFKLLDPSGNSSSWVYGEAGTIVVKDSTGNYHADYILDEEGRFYYRFEGTGMVDAAAEHHAEVRDSKFTA